MRLSDAAGNVGSAGVTNTITIDAAGPTLASAYPAAAGTGVATNTSIILTFSENIYANGGTVDHYRPRRGEQQFSDLPCGDVHAPHAGPHDEGG